MEDKEQQRHKLILTIIGVSILVVATIGATFAYFSATSNAAPQNITTGELKVTAKSEIQNNQNIKPATWDTTNMENNDNNKDIARIKLTVDTTGTTITTGKYDILLTTTGIQLNAKTDILDGGSLSDVKWALYKEKADETTDTTNGESRKIASGDFTKKAADGTNDTEGDSLVDGNVKDLKINGDTSINIAADPTGEEATSKANDVYYLYIWIENKMDTTYGDGSGKQDRLQNLTINATVTVDAKQE